MQIRRNAFLLNVFMFEWTKIKETVLPLWISNGFKAGNTAINKFPYFIPKKDLNNKSIFLASHSKIP